MSLSELVSHGSVTRAIVHVTFLRQRVRPDERAAPLPECCSLVRLERPSNGFYRYLYDTVGASHLWWLRRTLSARDLAALLAAPHVSMHVLYADGEPAGFFELDARAGAAVNLSYFGLMPHAVGRGWGGAFLRAATAAAWAHGPREVTVNTCTADHPRALPTYKRQGFEVLRTVREVWDIPDRLGLRVPERLRG